MLQARRFVIHMLVWENDLEPVSVAINKNNNNNNNTKTKNTKKLSKQIYPKNIKWKMTQMTVFVDRFLSLLIYFYIF